MVDQMTKLNKLGEQLGKINGVTALTDVTGFGLLGHIIEMAEGSGLSADIYYHTVPVIDGVKDFIKTRVFPDATTRNWNSYHQKVRFEKGVDVMEAFTLLPDPQTNGGLLFSVREKSKEDIVKLLKETGFENHIEPIGKFTSKGEKVIEIKK